MNEYENMTSIPRSLVDRKKPITLCIDLFYINGKPYFISISRRLMFTTAEALKNRTKGIMLSAVERCIAFYRFHDLKVRWIFADNEFGPIKDPLLIKYDAEVNTAAMKEHVPEIERNIRIVKDRIRSTLAGLPYDKLPTNFKR